MYAHKLRLSSEFYHFWRTRNHSVSN